MDWFFVGLFQVCSLNMDIYFQTILRSSFHDWGLVVKNYPPHEVFSDPDVLLLSLHVGDPLFSVISITNTSHASQNLFNDQVFPQTEEGYACAKSATASVSVQYVIKPFVRYPCMPQLQPNVLHYMQVFIAPVCKLAFDVWKKGRAFFAWNIFVRCATQHSTNPLSFECFKVKTMILKWWKRVRSK